LPNSSSAVRPCASDMGGKMDTRPSSPDGTVLDDTLVDVVVDDVVVVVVVVVAVLVVSIVLVSRLKLGLVHLLCNVV
jgi:hypothetical protein